MKGRRRKLLGIAVAAGCAVVAGASFHFGLFAQAPSNFRDSPFLRIDPDRIVVADSKGMKPCGECHEAEWGVWKDTKHAQGYDTMHKSESAQGILNDMGLRVTKRQEAVCMRCHYTVGPERKAVAGVSCESCHGPARDWINVHNKWGDGARQRAQETPPARATRIAASRQAGMLRPSTDIYGVTANCFECHTVPSEALVNKGGHSTGTAGFDLVKRVNTIRHDFLIDGKQGTVNQPIATERARIMFVIGKILTYEYSLRGMAAGTATGRYSSAMGRRVKDAARELEEVAGVVAIPTITDVLKAGSKARLVPNNRAELEGAAEQIRALGQRFAITANGNTLAALDRLMAGERKASVTASAATQDAPVATNATPAAGVRPAAGAGGSAQPKSMAGGKPAAATAAPLSAAGARALDMPGQVRARPAWFSGAGRSGVVGAAKCMKCHGEAEDWWLNDAHSSAGRRLFGESAKARQIAELYGVGAAGMERGDKICMSCHGTVDEASKTVREQGVSCESCHGAAADYLDPHEKGGNPQRGMRALKRAADRAQTCSGCHHVSDERLIAAGHPSGASYDAAKSSRAIKHWPGRKPDRGREKRREPAYGELADGAIKSAYASVIAGRPIPRVAVVAPQRSARASASAPASAGPAPAPKAVVGAVPVTTATASSAAAPVARASRSEAFEPVTYSTPPRMPERLSRRTSASVTLNLEQLPSTERMTTEELLLLVKKRIEKLYAAVGRGN